MIFLHIENFPVKYTFEVVFVYVNVSVYKYGNGAVVVHAAGLTGVVLFVSATLTTFMDF
jgi:hypothetical protein